MRRYTQDHEWVDVAGDVATVGITQHAQEALGDLVFVELPEIGRRLDKGESAATVESVKAASDVYVPLSGEIVETNAEIASDPSLVNASPEDKGWFFRIRMADPAQADALLDEDAYRKLIA